MKDEPAQYKKFSRRGIVLGGIKGVLLSALVGRLYQLQVVQSERYQIQAEENRISLRLIAPRRGLIYDRFGEILAGTRLKYRVVLVPEQTNGVAGVLDQLGRIIPLGERGRTRVLEMAVRQPKFIPITVAEDLSWEDFARVNVKLPKLAGVQADSAETRYYPEGELFAHVVGYVASPSGEDKNDPLIRLPDYRVGRSGLERSYEPRLRGRAGSSRVEVNAVGRVVREIAREDSTAGNDLVISIDRRLQAAAAQSFGEESGSAVILDVKTGDVLSLVSVPAFDPDAFNLGLTRAEWSDLLNDPKKPLVNKAIAGQYSPGSTFKMMVALAALQSGEIKPDFTTYCNGKTKIGDMTLHCWKERGHGKVDMTRGISESCDVYFYELAKRAGIEAITDVARRFGFGTAFDLGIGSAKSGFLPSAQWARAERGIPWTLGETMITGIGQGALLSTPMQLAVMTARLANGERRITPRLARHVGAAGGEAADEAAPLDMPPEWMLLIRQAMADVVNTPRGTAYRSRLRDTEHAMAGKTGTVQVVAISEEEREEGITKNEEKPWKFRDHAMFVGFAPVVEPRYALSVVVEHGGGGASTAAPIARRIMEEALVLDPVAKPVFSPAGEVAEA